MLGPTNRTASLSPDVNDPAYAQRHLRRAGRDLRRGHARADRRAASDLILIETIFDTLNAKAALFAVRTRVSRSAALDVPVMVSGTITDASGRTLSGQTTEAFWNSVRHADRSPSA